MNDNASVIEHSVHLAALRALLYFQNLKNILLIILNGLLTAVHISDFLNNCEWYREMKWL